MMHMLSPCQIVLLYDYTDYELGRSLMFILRVKMSDITYYDNMIKKSNELGKSFIESIQYIRPSRNEG